MLIEVQTQSPAAARPQIRIHEFATKPADEVIRAAIIHGAMVGQFIRLKKCTQTGEGFGARSW